MSVAGLLTMERPATRTVARIGYRADIDGLRAVAVLAVVFTHAGVIGFSGGFVGVDIFFVISGYLITRNLEHASPAGWRGLRVFYGRRMRRTLPALYLVAVVTIAAASVLLLPGEFDALARSLLAALLVVPNILFLSQAGYFDHAALAKPLLHTWSLGVEEQAHPAAGWGLLGGAVGDLGEGFGRRDPDAYGDAGPLQHGRAQLTGVRLEAIFESGQAQERLVDAVDLKLGRKPCEGLHHAGAEIAIQGVVARSDDHALLKKFHLLEVPGVAHDDAEGLGLVRARDHAPVVVRQHHHRLADQRRLKQPLAGRVEVVAVHQGDRRDHASQHTDRVGDHAPHMEVDIFGDY